jgi:hypothetical protein
MFEAPAVAHNGPVPRRCVRGLRAGAPRRWSPVPCAMPTLSSLARFTVPLGRQEIELAELVHDAGGMPLLRIRIRERSRFTIFDIDPVTARAWGEAMRRWGELRQREFDDAGTPE